jgi:hypothetical protein
MLAPRLLAVTGAALILGSPAFGEETPRRKPGLWEIAVLTAGQPSPALGQYCIDAKDDIARTNGTGVAGADCSEAAMKREGEGWVSESVCALRSSTVTTRVVYSGSFDSAYEGQSHATYSPPLYGRSEVKATIQAKWTGACK